MENLKRVQRAVREFLDVRVLRVEVHPHLSCAVRPAHVEIDVAHRLRWRPVDFAFQVQLPHHIERLRELRLARGRFDVRVILRFVARRTDL